MNEPKQSKPMTDEQLGRYCIKAMNRIIQQGCNAKPEDENKDAAQFVLDHIAGLQRERDNWRACAKALERAWTEKLVSFELEEHAKDSALAEFEKLETVPLGELGESTVRKAN